MELQRLSEEISDRARLPGGGRKKASQELEINMREWVISKRARHESVSRKMIRAMEKQIYATVSVSRDEEFAASVGWLNLQQLHLQRDAREFTERLAKFVTFSSGIFMSQIAAWSQINAWSVKWLKQIWYSMITLPARGERHASVWPIVLSCRHHDWQESRPLSVTLPTRP